MYCLRQPRLASERVAHFVKGFLGFLQNVAGVVGTVSRYVMYYLREPRLASERVAHLIKGFSGF